MEQCGILHSPILVSHENAVYKAVLQSMAFEAVSEPGASMCRKLKDEMKVSFFLSQTHDTLEITPSIYVQHSICKHMCHNESRNQSDFE
jgi:hypothetical protein